MYRILPCFDKSPSDLIKEAIRVKKILSVFLALTLLLACVTLQTSAEGAPAFAAGNAEANPGDTVEIPILIKNNPGIIALDVYVSFDRDVLTLQNATDALLFSDRPVVTFGGSYDTDVFHILWENLAGVIISGQR